MASNNHEPRADTPGAHEPREDEEILGGEQARTDLAWNRSGLALIVASAAILKVLVDIGERQAPAFVWFVLGAVAAGTMLMLGHGHFVAGPALAGRAQRRQARLRSVALTATLFGIFALVIAALPDR